MTMEHTPDPLMRALQGLPTQRTPPADGWARVHAALPPRQAPAVVTPITASAQRVAQRPQRSPRRRRWSLPLAAGLAAAVGALLLLPGLQRTPEPASMGSPRSAFLQVQVRHLDQDYGRAVATLPDALDRRWQPALEDIDRSAAQIRAALQQDPGSRSLFEQLQRTYALRLELTRQAASAAAGQPFARRPS